MTNQAPLIGFVGGCVLGQTMQECKTHGLTNFVITSDGRKRCEKCIRKERLHEEERD